MLPIEDWEVYSPAIYGFFGEYRFLSNFWPVEIFYNGLKFPSVEHAYQSAKTTDSFLKNMFTEKNITAGQAKKLGSQIKCVENWDNIKVDIMRELIFLKFGPLTQKLKDTAPKQLYELNTWGDKFWGVTRDKTGRLEGKNILGNLLMECRNNIEVV